jgi:uncharacterized protein (DUF1800 family)
MRHPRLPSGCLAAVLFAATLALGGACRSAGQDPRLAAGHGNDTRSKQDGSRGVQEGSHLFADDSAVVHLLNRIGYGPRTGDVERVQAMGVHEYILAQLNPEGVADPGIDERLGRYSTLEMETSDLAEMAYEEMRRRREAKRAAGAEGREGMEARRLPLLELAAARVERATHSERQLEEVLVDFWMNHFNVFAGKGADRILLTSYERDAVRPHVLGRFEDLLSATAHDPAMLFYLDNWLSVAPGATPPRGLGGKRVPSGINEKKRLPSGINEKKRLPSGINENYARELLELHTLGVDGGYTQEDVIEVARAFTGWSLDRPRRGGGFVFHEWAHDPGPKTVLGHALPAGGGEGDGEGVLHFLATHPSTARFVSTKLAQRFVADDPPESLVAKMEETWRLTDGDIREVLHTLLESEEFWDPVVFGAKVKTPFELLASTLRALDADVPPEPVLKALRAMNHFPYGAEAPTGYPEIGSAWLDAGTLDQRVQMAQLIAGKLPLEALDNADPTRGAELILGRLLPGGSSPELGAAVARALAEESPREALALALASPDFQKQ